MTRRELIEKGYNRVSLCDFSEYNSERCHNGGNYGFWDTYTLTLIGLWAISYHTTADFEYCPVCGMFEDHTYYPTDTFANCGV